MLYGDRGVKLGPDKSLAGRSGVSDVRGLNPIALVIIGIGIAVPITILISNIILIPILIAVPTGTGGDVEQ